MDIENSNAGERSGNKELQLIPLPHGALYFKNCLDEKGQLELVNICWKMSSYGGNETLLRRTKYQSTTKGPTPLMFYNWPARSQSIDSIPKPLELLNFATQIFGRAYDHLVVNQNNSSADSRFQCPSDFLPNAMYAIMYPHDGCFPAHLDGAKGWVLSISVGDSAEFFFMDGRSGVKTSVLIESGDAIIFNGGQLYHGIERVIPNSAPSFWNSKQSPLEVFEMSRLNIQFRDPMKDKLTYKPQFNDSTNAYTVYE